MSNISQPTSRSTRLREAANLYASVGWRVHPCHNVVEKHGGFECTCDAYNRQRADRDGRTFEPCLAPGKRPYVFGWHNLASCDLNQIGKWWSKAERGWPKANIGIATGEKSDLFVFDIDGESGLKQLSELIEKHGELPRTVTVRTGSGGLHYYFRWPKGANLRNTAKKIASSLDSRANGGYVIAPPSLHMSGKEYEFLPGCSPAETDLAEMPAWLLTLFQEANQKETKKPSPAKSRVQTDEIEAEKKAIADQTHGFDALLALIGDGEGLQGFDKSIYRAACSWMVQRDADESSAEELKATLLDRIRSAPKSADRMNFHRYESDEYLDRRIIDAQRFAATILRERAEASDGTFLFDDPDKLVRVINAQHAIVLMGGNARFVREVDGDIQFYSRAAMADWLAKYKLIVKADKSTKVIAGLKAWLEHPSRREYDAVVFEPSGAPARHLNLWRGLAVEPSPGDWSLLQDHIFSNVCAGSYELYEWVISWMAQIVQQPHVKPGSALVLRGRKGTGKSKMLEHFASLFGDHAITIASSKHLTGNFNAHLGTKILVVSEEGFWAGDKNAEGTLKHMITGDRMILERKGIDPVEVNSYVHLAITSNEGWVVPATGDERRFLVLDVADSRQGDRAYFGAVEAQMQDGGCAAMLFDLLQFDHTRCNLRQPPLTPSLSDQVLEGFKPIFSWWHDCLTEGRLVGLGFEHVDRDASWPESGRFTVDRDLVQASYQANVRDHSRSKARTTTLGMFLRQIVPGLIDGPRGTTLQGERERSYIFPSLADCRRAFTDATMVGFGDVAEFDEDDPYLNAARALEQGLAMSLFDEEQHDQPVLHDSEYAAWFALERRNYPSPKELGRQLQYFAEFEPLSDEPTWSEVGGVARKLFAKDPWIDLGGEPPGPWNALADDGDGETAAPPIAKEGRVERWKL
jgi:hypothetical protein